MKSIFKLSFIASLIFCSQLAFGQTEMTTEKSSDESTKEIEEVPQIFKDYTWLKDMVNPDDCAGAIITVLTSTANSAHHLVVVNHEGKKVMYDASGKYHCADHSTVNCKEFYKLDKEVDSWTCK